MSSQRPNMPTSKRNPKGAGRKPGLPGKSFKKTKLKAPEALKVTKGIRYTPQQIERIAEAARKSGSKNFSQFVVTASVEKADAMLKRDG